MSRHKITAIRSGSHPTLGDWEAEYEITFEYRAGSPDYWNRAGGHWEQGWAAEVEAIDIKPEIGTLDAREHAEALDWAQMWLDFNYDKAVEEVASDHEAARDFAAELRADR